MNEQTLPEPEPQEQEQNRRSARRLSGSKKEHRNGNAARSERRHTVRLTGRVRADVQEVAEDLIRNRAELQ